MAFSGRPIWVEWNAAIAATPAADLPLGLTPRTKVFEDCGFIRIATDPELPEYDLYCLEQLDAAGLRHHQHVLSNADDMSRLGRKDTDGGADSGHNWQRKMDAFKPFTDGKRDAFIDTSAGLTYADKSCIWARHLCEKAGVRFILGPKRGKFSEMVVAASATGAKVVNGVKSADGVTHPADVVIVAAGGWTPSIVPEVSGALETTAGSVITIQLPLNRKDLWDKYSPDNFPVFAYGLTGHDSPEYAGFYGFPRTPDGKIKIGYRGRKWTNYQTEPATGKRLSVPKTKYTPDRQVNLPLKAITNLKGLIAEMFPDLKTIGITDTRMCWYTDSVDNSFLIDYVPGYGDSLFVASGGSGHGFKFLPVLGEHVVHALEKKTDQFTPLWRWRTAAPGEHANGLEEGEFGGRNLADLTMATEEDWKFPETVEKSKL